MSAESTTNFWMDGFFVLLRLILFAPEPVTRLRMPWRPHIFQSLPKLLETYPSWNTLPPAPPAPTALHLLLLHLPQYPAKTLVLLNLAQILHAVPARYVQQHLRIIPSAHPPTSLFHLKMTPNQLRYAHRLQQIQVYRQTRQTSHPCIMPLFFVLESQNRL
jgi:hypothetical protein